MLRPAGHTITGDCDALAQPLLMQGHPRLVAQDCVQIALGYLQGWQLQQPVPVADDPHSGKVFPALRQGLMCFSS